jgi:HSP20 family molecular chaperone IbpA
MSQHSFFKFCPPDAWQPATNLYETEDHYIVCMDLAGVNRPEICVEIKQDMLVITGSRESPRPQSRSKVHLMEIDHGNFCRSVAIPSSVSVEKIDARYARSGALEEPPVKPGAKYNTKTWITGKAVIRAGSSPE